MPTTSLCLCVSLSLCPHLLKRVFAFSDLKWRKHACRRTSTTTAAAAATFTTTTFSSDAQGWSRAKNAAQIEAAAATTTTFSSTRKAGQHRRRTTIIIPPEATNTAPVLTGGPGAAPGGVALKNGQGHMRVQRGVISYSPRCLSPLQWQLVLFQPNLPNTRMPSPRYS